MGNNILFSRHWAMPNANTFSIKPIKELLLKYIPEGEGNSPKVIIDPFARNNKWGNITNDLNPDCSTKYHLDARDFVKKILDEKGEEFADIVLFDPPYCYDKETEIFTKRGWKKFEELKDDDIVATLNPKTNNLEYHKPLEIIKKKYKGEMVFFNSQSINLLVSPNHRMWVREEVDKGYKFEFAKDIIYRMQNIFLTQDGEAVVLQENIEKIKDFDDFIYCVRVPNEIVLVKRNGRVCWCGNSPRQIQECYQHVGLKLTTFDTRADFYSKIKDSLGKMLKLDSIALSFCWNSNGFGKKRGFEIIEVVLVAHGGWHSDTICTVERKIKNPDDISKNTLVQDIFEDSDVREK